MWNFKIIKKIIHKKIHKNYKAKMPEYNLDYKKIKSPIIFNKILIIDSIFKMDFIYKHLSKKNYDLLKIDLNKITQKELEKISKYKIIVVSEELFFLVPLLNERNIICFWHGLTTYKNISSRYFLKYKPPFSKVVIGTKNTKLFSKLFKISDDKIINLPSPTIDEIHRTSTKSKEILKELNITKKIKKIYFFCFSFEERPEFKTNIFFDFKKLEKELNEDELIIYNIHPSLYNKNTNYYNSEKIRFEKNTSTTSLISISDVVITDYSSSVSEAIIMDKKIMFLMENFYSYDRGFIYRKNCMPGKVITSNNPKKIISNIRSVFLSKNNKKYIIEKELIINKSNSIKANIDYIKNELKEVNEC